MIDPEAVDTSGGLSSRTTSLLTALEEEIAFCKCETSESEWLIQRLRSNAFFSLATGTTKQSKLQEIERIQEFYHSLLVVG